MSYYIEYIKSINFSMLVHLDTSYSNPWTSTIYFHSADYRPVTWCVIHNILGMCLLFPSTVFIEHLDSLLWMRNSADKYLCPYLKISPKAKNLTWEGKRPKKMFFFFCKAGNVTVLSLFLLITGSLPGANWYICGRYSEGICLWDTSLWHSMMYNFLAS